MDITVKNFFKPKTSEEYTRCFDRMDMYFKLTEYANEDRFPLDGKLLLNAYYAFIGAMQELSEEDQQLITARFINHQPAKKTMEEMDLTRGVYQNRLRKARYRLVTASNGKKEFKIIGVHLIP